MIAKSVSIIRANYRFYLLFAVVALALTALGYSGVMPGSVGIATVFIWQLLARFVTRSTLFGIGFTARNPDGSVDNVVDSFILKAIALAVASFVIAVPFMLAAFWNQVLASENPSADVFISILVIIFAAYSAVLAVAGSWLPASLQGERRSLTDAIRRAPTTFLPVFIRVFPTLLVGTLAQVPVVMLGLDSPVFGLVLSAVAILIQCATVTLAAVILAHYYQRFEERIRAGAGQPV